MKLDKGFTIIELIVVMAVFMLVVGAVVSLFISIIQSQKRVLSEQQLLNQISYVEEYMSKALRMAKSASTTQDINCLNNQGFIYLLTHYDITSGLYRGVKFINQSDNDACQEFFLDIDGILKEKKASSLPVALTSASLRINSIKFSINGSDGSALGCGDTNQCGASNEDVVQPKITTFLNVRIEGDDQSTDRTVQTTVSQRNLNIQ